jgi:hypothetical protein
MALAVNIAHQPLLPSLLLTAFISPVFAFADLQGTRAKKEELFALSAPSFHPKKCL